MTLDEIQKKEEDSTSKGQDSLKGKESNSKDTPNITLKEHEKGIEDAIAQYGDRVKQEKIDPITKERDTFKAQAEEATTTLEETKGRITDLEADLEQAIGEDVDQLDIQKIKKDLRTERENAKKEAKAERDAISELRKTLESEREEWAGTVAEAQTFKFDGELARLVDDYDGDVTANFTKLKTACDKAGVKTKEGAEAIAETFLTKKVEEPELLDDPGVTSGGGGWNPEEHTPKENIDKGLEKLKKK